MLYCQPLKSGGINIWTFCDNFTKIKILRPCTHGRTVKTQSTSVRRWQPARGSLNAIDAIITVCVSTDLVRTKWKLNHSSNWQFTYARRRDRSRAAAAESAHFKGYLSLTPPYVWFLERRGPKFEQMKITFDAKNFIRILSRSISNDFGAISKCLSQPP